MDKKWEVAPKISKNFQNEFPEISSILLQLLHNRGLKDQEKIDEFLNPDYGQDIHDPFLFGDMGKATERILKAVREKEKIIVYGDYDADGMTSAAVLSLTLEALGAEGPDVYIPEKESEGYGLNNLAVEKFARQKVSLIITVDCGISDKVEIELANELGIDVIVTDHHYEPPELPDAFAIINSKLSREKYPFKDLAGVGAAFKLAQALLIAGKKGEDEGNFTPPQRIHWEGFEKWLLDLVAVGTVADRMPLFGENRTLVKYGLVVLNKLRRVGMKSLISVANISKNSLDTGSIGFQIGPRLNAAGRFNHSNSSYRLLVTKSGEEAENLSQKLDQTNKKRQKIVDQITAQARQIVEGQDKGEVLVAANFKDDAWPTGLVGLAAGKLCDEYNRPALVISRSEKGLVGSGRSIPQFNLIRAVQSAKEFLLHFGGHAGACGFTLKSEKDLEKFKNKLTEIAKKELAGQDLTPSLFIDAQVELGEVNWNLYEEIEKLEPFGEKNNLPKFLIRNLAVIGLEKVGQSGKHLKIIVADFSASSGDTGNKMAKKTIGFGIGNSWGEELKIGDKIDMVFELGVNEWNGNRELQLKITDLRKSS